MCRASEQQFLKTNALFPGRLFFIASLTLTEISEWVPPDVLNPWQAYNTAFAFWNGGLPMKGARHFLA